MPIPKIIWALWCNFNHKSDGVLSDDLIFFTDRIKTIHPGWDIHIITRWAELMDYIREDDLLTRVVNNTHIGGAHKSDMIRFFLLRNYGGCWIDISTFLVSPLDHLIEQNTDFICYYANANDTTDWILKTTSDIYEQFTYTQRTELSNDIKGEFISFKPENEDFNFIPENYFICASKDHPIIINVYGQLTAFWGGCIDKIHNSNDLCFYQNLNVYQSFSTIFNNNIFDLVLFKNMYEPRLNDFLDFEHTNKNIVNPKDSIYQLMKNTFDCGYLFNYLHMYLGIVWYCKKHAPYNVEITSRNDENIATINETHENSKFFNILCSDRLKPCNDLVIHLRGKPSVTLLSATYNRAGKWSDLMEERLSWNKTFLGEMISNIETPEQATEALHVFDQLGLTQFKFGAWTRDSPVIKKLKKWYGPMNETSASASASGRKTRRVRRKRSNKKTNKRKGRRSNRKTNKRN
jgi:hypothetical protein